MEDELKNEMDSEFDAVDAVNADAAEADDVSGGSAEDTASDESSTAGESVVEEAVVPAADEDGEAETVGADESAPVASAAGAASGDGDDEGDDLPPVDDVEEEVDPSDLEKSWYILKVQVNRETSICETLKRRVQQYGLSGYFGEMLVPTEDVREYTKSGKQRIVKRKLYPGYIMVHMAITEDSWWLVRDTPGIGDFTGMGGKPAPLADEEIKRIMKAVHPEVVDEGDGKEEIKTANPGVPGSGRRWTLRTQVEETE